ncbi:hypothetical protein ACP4OV_021812 [Aristida adscensionis]
MAQPQLVPSRAHGSRSDDETHTLVAAWAPLYERRRRGGPSYGDGRVKVCGHVAGAALAELLGVVMRGGVAAEAGGTSSGNDDAAVVTALGGAVTKLADVYRHCSLKRMELAMEKERVAAAGSGQKPCFVWF